jgi:adenosylhomocysteine nucleosidase
MLLIAAALSEELSVAKEMCTAPVTISGGGIRAWTAEYKAHKVFFLKTGMGPIRSARNFEQFLAEHKPAEVLVIGYAGALDPALQPGDLVMAERAAFLSAPKKSPLREAAIGEYWELAANGEIANLCRARGVEIRAGGILTSPFVVGDPAQKKWLYEHFGAAIVDMETAELARIAASKSLPLRCVRSISDSATDDFFAPLSHDPDLNPASKAAKLVAAGRWLERCQQWRQNSSVARESMRRFLSVYLDAYASRTKSHRRDAEDAEAAKK